MVETFEGVAILLACYSLASGQYVQSIFAGLAVLGAEPLRRLSQRLAVQTPLLEG